MKVSIEDNTKKAIDAVQGSMQTALTGACIIVQGTAILDAPVDTGNLRGSITFEVAGDEGKIGTNVEYAPYVEVKKPYLEPALVNNKKNIERYVSQVIGGALK